MDSRLEETLTRAFRLAYFIHRDKDTSLAIAAGALSKLEVAAAAQDKRLYYVPAGRGTGDASHQRRPRTKVAMSELHLLQRLVYVESEVFEKRQEAAGTDARLDEEDMIIRFIKHLVRITTRRNSFYVALGLGRLLYQYSTNETAEIYDLVIQDSERFKDDHYYRSRKRRLVQELSERFGALIRLTKSKGGEERFEAQDEPASRVPLVSGCLAQFTPWNTTCPLPDRRDLRAEEILALRFDGTDPDQEHPVEIRRMHALIHPGCLSRLVTALGFDSTEARLTVPRFLLKSTDGDNGGRGDRATTPELTDEEMMLVGAELAENARRRKASSARLLAIRVDGVQVAAIDLSRESSASFQVEEGSELIEIVARDRKGELLLASHLLTLDEDSTRDSARFAISLEGGQNLAFELSARGRGAGLTDGFIVEVTYAESSMVRAAALYARRLLWRIAGASGAGASGFRIRTVPALAAGLALVLAVGFLIYLRPWRPSGPGPIAKGTAGQGQSGNNGGAEVPTVSPSPNQTGTIANANAASPGGANPGGGIVRNGGSQVPANRHVVRVPQPLPDDSTIAKKEQVDQNREAAPDQSVDVGAADTRGMDRIATKQLAAIKHIYVDSLGSDDFSGSVGRAIGEALNRGGQPTTISTVSTRDRADAVLKGSAVLARPDGDGAIKGTVSLKLVAADGSTLWSWPHPGSAAGVAETPARLASVASTDLIERIRAAKSK